MIDMTLTITDQGQAQLVRIARHLDMLRQAYGDQSGDYRETAESFARTIGRIAELGGKVSGDSDLSLYIVTEYGMHVGAVFHTADGYRRGKRMGEYGGHTEYCAVHENVMVAGKGACESDGTPGRFQQSECFAHPTPVPVAGTWSLHS